MLPARLLARLVGVEAPRALLRHKARSALAAVGIGAGVAAVIWVVAIGQTGTARAKDELRKLGDNLVWIEAGSRTVGGLRLGAHGTTSLTPGDAEAIRREVPLLTRVSENVDGRVQVASATSNWGTQYRGVSPEYLEVKAYRMALGSFFTADQVRHAESVAVLGETVRYRLYGIDDPVGAIVRIGKFPFMVVGVAVPKGPSADGRDLDDMILVPWTAAQKKLRGHDATYLDDILCSATSMEAVDTAVGQVRELLRQRHGIGGGKEEDFNIRRPDEVMKAQIQASETLERLLMALASIALLVGGIGIANVQLASVTARTREIGVRMAVGATAAAVRAQFLGEAAALSLLGVALGVPVSLAGASTVGALIGWDIGVPPGAIAVAVGVSAVVGLVSGFYPALLASRLDPIEALRAE